MHRNRSIADMVGWRLRNAVILSTVAAIIGIDRHFLGVLSGLRRNKAVDVTISSASLFAMSVPEFVSATLLILVFNIGLGWTTGVVTVGAKASFWDILSTPSCPRRR